MLAETRHSNPGATGHNEASDLLPLIYSELRRLARSRLARLQRGQTMTPTDLVHDAYLRLANGQQERFEGRRHVFFAASRAMRDIMVERARRKASRKRGGDYRQVEMTTAGSLECQHGQDLLDLSLALRKLELRSPERAEVVQLSYFGGLTHPEIGEVLGLSRATVERRWSYARTWLRRELSQAAPRERALA